MESWYGSNIYTTNFSRILELMNLSTAEWSVASFPSNLVAIAGSLADETNGAHFTNMTATEFDAMSTPGSRDIEKLLFGLVSGIIILWASCWLLYQYRMGTLLSAPGSSPLLESDEGSTEEPAASHGAVQRVRLPPNQEGAAHVSDERYTRGTLRPMTTAKFIRTLQQFYYEPIETELEACVRCPPDSEDVKDVTELVRKLLGKEAELRADPGMLDAHRTQIKRDKASILSKIRGIVENWDPDKPQRRKGRWTAEERSSVEKIRRLVESLLSTNM